jgi:SAM-dependent methyltransferase
VLGVQASNDWSEPASFTDNARDGVFDVVRDGYEAVYEALPSSNTFSRLWREQAYDCEFPLEFAHIGFLTLSEARRVLDLLRIGQDDILVDVACGAGGPGLWMAQQTGASLVGIDPATAGLRAARRRAAQAGLDGRSRFQPGTFERTGLPDGSADAVVTIEALQYAPDKRSAITEFTRILRPGGRLAVVCFEVDPVKAHGLPVLGADPIADYKPLLADAGLLLDNYSETPEWQQRTYGAFRAIADANDMLIQEMGVEAASAAVAEALLTLQVKPYPRRVLIGATKRP